MTTYQIVAIILRALHILSGVTWVGALFLVTRVVLARPGGGALLGELAADGRLRAYIAAASGLTVLSGIALAWWIYDFQMSGGTGMIVLGLGALAGVVAMFVGPVINRISARDKDAASPAVRRLWSVFAGLAGFAALCMATFRYF